MPFNLVPSPTSVVSLLWGIREFLWAVPPGKNKANSNDEMELNKVRLQEWYLKESNTFSKNIHSFGYYFKIK